MIKTWIIIYLIGSIAWTSLHGQDGSDIYYMTVDELGDSCIGDFVHLDFYNQSRPWRVDTITMTIDGQAVKFVEHRTDDGMNNWFRRQYLASLGKKDGFYIRVVKSRLEKITVDSVFVTGFVEYYNGDALLPDRSQQIVRRFPRSIIAEVLVSQKSHRGRRRP